MQALFRFFSRLRKKKDTFDGPNINLSQQIYPPTSLKQRSKKSDIECRVTHLDGEEFIFYLSKHASASKLYENVFQQLEFTQEQDYFALQFVDSRNINRWLDVTKTIEKQCNIGPPYLFKFQVKFYSSDPHNLRDEMTRYLFVQQLRQDIRNGRLSCDPEIGSDLGSLLLQGEFGDYDPQVHTPEFVSEFRFLPDNVQTEEFELDVLEKYKNLCGHNMTPAVTEKIYLEKIRVLDSYGVDMHLVKGKDDGDYSLGLTPSGILIYEGDTKIGLFAWDKINQLEFRRNRLKVAVTDEIPEVHNFVFSLPSTRHCKHVWKCAVEHHAFFRLSDSKRQNEQQPSRVAQFFRLRSRFQSTFRTEYQLHRMNTFGTSTRRSSSFVRTPSVRFSARASMRGRSGAGEGKTRKEKEAEREERRAAVIERIRLEKMETEQRGLAIKGPTGELIKQPVHRANAHPLAPQPADMQPIKATAVVHPYDNNGPFRLDDDINRPIRPGGGLIKRPPLPPTLNEPEMVKAKLVHGEMQIDVNRPPPPRPARSQAPQHNRRTPPPNQRDTPLIKNTHSSLQELPNCQSYPRTLPQSQIRMLQPPLSIHRQTSDPSHPHYHSLSSLLYPSFPNPRTIRKSPNSRDQSSFPNNNLCIVHHSVVLSHSWNLSSAHHPCFSALQPAVQSLNRSGTIKSVGFAEVQAPTYDIKFQETPVKMSNNHNKNKSRNRLAKPNRHYNFSISTDV